MIRLIAARELATRGLSRGFLVISGILFVAVLAIAVGLSLFDGDDGAREVTIALDGDGVELAEALSVGTDELAPTTLVTEDGPALLEDGDVDVVFDGRTLVWEGSPDDELDAYIRAVAQQQALAERADALGLTTADVSGLFAEVGIDEVRLDDGDDDRGVRLAAAAVAGLATFMLIQVWGSFIMMGVIEEKSSRVVEVLLSHVRPPTLLGGKILGLGFLALAQLSIIVLGMVLGLALVRDVDVPSGVWGTVPLFVVTFLLGFAFYATAFAAVGSMVSRQEDAQTAQLPAVLPLLIGYMIAAASFGSPENAAVTIGSYVPFTSPVLLPFRTAMVDVATVEILASLVILAASSVVMLRLAGRIYRYSLLRTGTRVSWTEAWQHRNQQDL